MALTRTTQLNAINVMLGVIGEAPVNALNDPAVDATIARQVLDEVTLDVLDETWNFNRDVDVTLSPDGDSKIELGSDVLRVEKDQYSDKQYVFRGGFLYDATNNTFEHDNDVTVTLVKIIQFDDLPQAAKSYIQYRAARIFRNRMLNEKDIQTAPGADENSALIKLRQHDLATADYSIFDEARTRLARGRRYPNVL